MQHCRRMFFGIGIFCTGSSFDSPPSLAIAGIPVNPAGSSQ